MIVSGYIIQEELFEELNGPLKKLKQQGIVPRLGALMVGNHPPSLIYVRKKEEACKKLGIDFELVTLKDAKKMEILEAINYFNNNKDINGILCQLPLPDESIESEILSAIDPLKDVDCYHPSNLNKLYQDGSDPLFFPVTPYAIYLILKHLNINITGKEVVILGRGPTVGRPLSILLSKRGYDATVTLVHSKSEKVESICKRADILVAAIGSPKYVTDSFVKKDAIIIDVGINRINNKVIGDVDFDKIKDIVKFITPVPGGVGPVTIAVLMKNIVDAALLQNGVVA